MILIGAVKAYCPFSINNKLTTRQSSENVAVRLDIACATVYNGGNNDLICLFLFPTGRGDFLGPRYWMASKTSEKNKEPPPESIKEVPGYLLRVLKSVSYRLFYIFSLVWEAKPWILFFMLFISVFNGVMPVIGSFISAHLLNSLAAAYVGNIDFNVIVTLLVARFAHIFIGHVVSEINTMVTRISGELVVNHIKLKIMNKAKEIDLRSFDQPEFYSKLENANREAGNRPLHILNSTFALVSTCISSVSFIIILAAVSPYAPVIILAMAFPSAIINFIYRKKNAVYVRARSKERRQMGYYQGLITNTYLVKEARIFNLADTFINRYCEVFKSYYKGLRKLYTSEGFWHIGLSFVRSIVNCSLFVYIASKVWHGGLQVGDYSLYTGALNAIAGGVGAFIGNSAAIYEGTLFIDNMIDFMKEKRTVVPLLEEPRHPKRGCGHTIEFKDVSFRYPGTERDVIKNVNLTLKPGDTTVLVGLNGAGKTTLIKLLTRLYDPTEGIILLDGYDIREYDVNELYSLFGIIFQDFGKYAVTAKENIIFGEIERDIVHEDIVGAADNSNSRQFIEAMPQSYDTPLTRIFEENGMELSGGEWQKLAIARAFYRNSDILILDEPTSALDAIAEQDIYNQFDRLRQDKLTIFVSHRLSSATVASKIVVLQYGQIIEEGNHAELMALGGHYHKLFSTQASRYITDTGINMGTLEDGSDDYTADDAVEDLSVHNGRPRRGHRHGLPDGIKESSPQESSEPRSEIIPPPQSLQS